MSHFYALPRPLRGEAYASLCLLVRIISLDARRRYLLQQNYQTQDIVILTPYVAQLQEVRLALSRSTDLAVVMNERDAADLQDHLGDDEDGAEPPGGNLPGGNPPGGNAPGGNHNLGARGAAPKNHVRVATIDNFQGEEAKIILLSLVRCNDAGNIGFLHDEGRVTVLLSRARDGLIILGNRETLTSSRKGAALWNGIFHNLDAHNQVFEGLPIKCMLHDTPELLTTVESFDRCSPNGGCSANCGVQLACGHMCPKRCHYLDRDHRNTTCPVCDEIKRLERAAEQRRQRRIAKEQERQRKLEKEVREHNDLMEQLQQDLDDARADKAKKAADLERAKALATQLDDLRAAGVAQTPEAEAEVKRVKEQLEENKKVTDAMNKATKKLADCERLIEEELSKNKLLLQRQQRLEKIAQQTRLETAAKLKETMAALESIRKRPNVTVKIVRELAGQPESKAVPRTILKRNVDTAQHGEQNFESATAFGSGGGGGGGGGAAKDDNTSGSSPLLIRSHGAHLEVSREYLQQCTSNFEDIVVHTAFGDIYNATDPNIPESKRAVLRVDVANACARGYRPNSNVHHLQPSTSMCDLVHCNEKEGCYVYNLEQDRQSIAELLRDDVSAQEFGWKLRVRTMSKVATLFRDHGATPAECIFVAPPDFDVRLLGLQLFKAETPATDVEAMCDVIGYLLTGVPQAMGSGTDGDRRCGPWEVSVVSALRDLIADLRSSTASLSTACHQLEDLVNMHCSLTDAEVEAMAAKFRCTVQRKEVQRQEAVVQTLLTRSEADVERRLVAEETTRECCTCYEEYPISDGTECGGTAPPYNDDNNDNASDRREYEAHFVCKDCLEQFLLQEIRLPVTALLSRKGHIFCPARNDGDVCKSSPCYRNPIPRQTIARLCSKEVHDEYYRRQVELSAQPVIEQLEKDYESRVEAEVARRRALSEKQQKVRKVFLCA